MPACLTGTEKESDYCRSQRDPALVLGRERAPNHFQNAKSLSVGQLRKEEGGDNRKASRAVETLSFQLCKENSDSSSVDFADPSLQGTVVGGQLHKGNKMSYAARCMESLRFLSVCRK